MSFVVIFLIGPVAAQESFPGFLETDYDADPLNLIAGYDVTTTYTLDEDL